MSSSVFRSEIRVALGRRSSPQEHLMTFQAPLRVQQEVGKKKDPDVVVMAFDTD